MARNRFKLVEIQGESDEASDSVPDPATCLSLPDQLRQVIKRYPFVYLD